MAPGQNVVVEVKANEVGEKMGKSDRVIEATGKALHKGRV